MNKKLLKLLLTMSLCLSISGCEFGDDDEEFDWGSASVCGIFEDYFGSFEARKNYSAEEEGAIFYGQCNEFECAGNGLISINCDGNASGTVNETCNGNNYNFTGSASVESDIEIDATQVFFDADTETVGGSVTATINTLALTLDTGSGTGTISCSGKITYSDFATNTFSCDDSNVTCTIGVSTSVECATIKSTIDSARAEASGRELCAGSSSSGPTQDLIELAIMKIEDAIEGE